MGFIALKCPSCGASIELDENREFGFCSYCGTKVMQDKKVVELKGEVKVDGVSTADKLLERSYILIEDNEFNEAEGYFNRVLELDPKCAKAYWGKMLCEYRLFSADEAVKLGIDISKSNNYSRAVQYADGEQKKQYIEFGEKAAGIFNENKQKALNEQKKRKKLKNIAMAVFAFLPVIIFIIYLEGTDATSGPLRKIVIWLLSAVWVSSYFVRKKLNTQKSDNKKSISFVWLIFGGLFVLGSMFMPFGTSVSSNDSTDGTSGTSVVTTTEPTTEAPIEISATKLVKAYIDNEVKADTMYEDKTVIVSGYVDRIGQTNNMIFENEIIVYVGSGDSMESCLRCYVSMDQKDVVANLDVGDKITVTGRCTGLGSSYFNLKCVNIYDSIISE